MAKQKQRRRTRRSRAERDHVMNVIDYTMVRALGPVLGAPKPARA